MERPEVPLEQSQEEMLHYAEETSETWVMGVALTAALLAVIAAITALLAEHHANEAMLDQIQCSDQWNYYQAKGIKANVLETKSELFKALGKTPEPEDMAKLKQYREQQESIKDTATEKQQASEAHLRHHTVLSGSVTMFQIGIAVGAIAVLTKRRSFWFGSLAFGILGVVLFVLGVFAR